MSPSRLSPPLPLSSTRIAPSPPPLALDVLVLEAGDCIILSLRRIGPAAWDYPPTPLTHDGCEVECSPLLLVGCLDIGSLDEEKGNHLSVPHVGSVVEWSLPRPVPHVELGQLRE